MNHLVSKETSRSIRTAARTGGPQEPSVAVCGYVFTTAKRGVILHLTARGFRKSETKCPVCSLCLAAYPSEFYEDAEDLGGLVHE